MAVGRDYGIENISNSIADVRKVQENLILGEHIGSYKGFILENFVAQELFSITNSELASWQQGTAELEFIITNSADILPIEVKSSTKSRRAKSLDTYITRYNPKCADKLTRQNFSFNAERKITPIPVYCSYKLPTL